MQYICGHNAIATELNNKKMMKKLSFDLNSQFKIEFSREKPNEELFPSTEMDIKLSSKKGSFILEDSVMLEFVISDLAEFLTRLNAKQYLEESLKENELGYLYNIEMFNLWKCDDIKNVELPIQLRKQWYDYYLLWAGKKYLTWLYNNGNSFCIQITHIYPDLEALYLMHKPHEAFKNWLLNFKPLFTIEFNKENAKEVHKKFVGFDIDIKKYHQGIIDNPMQFIKV